MKLLAPAGEPGVTARSRLSAEHVAAAVAALCLVLFGVIHATTDVMVFSLFSIAPLVAATVADERRTAAFAGAAVALAIGAGWWDGATGSVTYWIRVAVVCAICAMAVVVAGMRRRREERLARMTAIAEAAQLALLPPLPPEMTGITIAARYRSATREASVGGDLYEIIPTGHGIRVIIGDVRGKGLDAVLLARHVLSAFRRSAVAMPRSVAVVVPSPARSWVFEATSRTICAPIFLNLSSSSISLATVTPSLVMRGAPYDLSRTTLRPFGPRFTFTALLRTSTPRSILSRASVENLTSFADMIVDPYFKSEVRRSRRQAAFFFVAPAPSITPMTSDSFMIRSS